MPGRCGIPKQELSKIEWWCHEVLKHGKTSLVWQRKRAFEAGTWSNSNREKASPYWSHRALGPLTELTCAVWFCWTAMNNTQSNYWNLDWKYMFGTEESEVHIFPGKVLVKSALKAYYQEKKLHYSAHFELTNTFFLIL